jgi:topoisomerase-4 subunit A
LTADKVKQINLLDPLPFEEPKEPEPEKMEVTDEESVSDDIKTDLEDDGQIGLSFE